MRKSFLICIVFLALMAPAGILSAQQPSGTVSIDEVELAYIFNGTRGGGALNFQGNTYSFKLGGLGVGGIGVSHITASGEVYNLQNIADFPGAYAEAGMGLSVGDQGKGHLWLQNQNGVQLHLITSQEGLGLTSGADGVVITMDQ
jgi:hypothetical protein